MLRIDAQIYRVDGSKATIWIEDVKRFNANGDISQKILILKSTKLNAVTFYVMDHHKVIPCRYYHIPAEFTSRSFMVGNDLSFGEVVGRDEHLTHIIQIESVHFTMVEIQDKLDYEINFKRITYPIKMRYDGPEMIDLSFMNTVLSMYESPHHRFTFVKDSI